MKITVINGTEIKGCTYHIKESFLEILRDGNEITEFYLPKDLPHFCCGCKKCFFKSEQFCPHAEYTIPIWNAILNADLLIFASPVYALRTTAQMKSLLDHLCVHWMVHRPDERMFNKRAVILTNAIGVFNGGAQKDIATSLSWLGAVSYTHLGLVLNRALKEIDPTFVAGVKLSNNTVTSIGVNVMKTTNIKPNTADKEGLKTIIKLVKQGASLLIFPEGTRSRVSSLIEAKKGIFLIAKMIGAPIVT